MTVVESLAPKTNITDLCTDCLLRVFRYLNVDDLANLTAANITGKLRLGKRTSKVNRFKEAIVTAFKIRKGVHEWKVSVHTSANYAPNDIKMLRSFGREIEELIVDYRNFKMNRRYEKALEDAVSGNCSKTLAYINFHVCNADSMHELDRSFRNVESVEFLECHVGYTLGKLKKWFPKMQHLNFEDSYVSDSHCIHEHFPRLKSFKVWNGEWRTAAKEKMIFTNADLKAFILLNPQLETLDVRHNDVDESQTGDDVAIMINWDLLTFINMNLRLATLKLNFENFPFESEWPSTVTMGSVTLLEVRCASCYSLDKIKVTKPYELILIFNNCTVAGQQRSNTDYGAIASFVIRAKPKLLKIVAEFDTFALNDVLVSKMIRMSKLQEFTIDCVWNDNLPNAIVNLLLHCNELEKLEGIFRFESDDKGDACPKYLRMREIFQDDIDRHRIVAKWLYKFVYVEGTDDDFCDFYYSDSVRFERKEGDMTG